MRAASKSRISSALMNRKTSMNRQDQFKKQNVKHEREKERLSTKYEKYLVMISLL